MRETIAENQFIQYERVISCYYRIEQNELQESFDSFLETILELGYTSAHPLFYSINSGILDDNKIIVQLFLPVNEENAMNLPEGFRYQSYFQVLNMISTRVKGTGEMREVSLGITRLFKYININGYKEMTPIFYFVYVDDCISYTDIMIGIY